MKRIVFFLYFGEELREKKNWRVIKKKKKKPVEIFNDHCRCKHEGIFLIRRCVEYHSLNANDNYYATSVEFGLRAKF